MKALDGTAVTTATITRGGTLAWDRTVGLFGPTATRSTGSARHSFTA